MANQGYVSKENMKDSQKQFGSAKANYKELPKNGNLKDYKEPDGTERGPAGKTHRV